MRVETERLYLYPISNDEMRFLIEKETDIEMKQAYKEGKDLTLLFNNICYNRIVTGNEMSGEHYE